MAAWSKIKFFYDSLPGSPGSTLTADSTEASGDYDVDYIHNFLEVNSWKAANATSPQHITLDLGDRIANGGFETGALSPWTGWTTGAGAATFSVSASNPYAGAYKALIDITNGGGGYGDVHFAQEGLQVRKGEKYILSFAAKASGNRNVQVRLIDPVPWIDPTSGGGQTIAITTSWAVYTVTFTIVSDSNNVRCDFLLGGAVGSVDLDEIKMERVSDADYLAVIGHNLYTAGASIYLEYSDDNVNWTEAWSDTPAADTVMLDEFASPGLHRRWRVRLYKSPNNFNAPPYMAICVWGLKTELDYASLGFDPHGQEAKANINVTQGGYVSGIHTRYTERQMTLSFQDADSALYDKIKTWWEKHGPRNLFVAWETTNNPSDVWLMRPDARFDNPLVAGGLYRDITVRLRGRKE